MPALFAQWTGAVLDAAGVAPGHSVLDVACGTGVLAREAAVRVGPRGSVFGIDLNPGMLQVAARLAPAVGWRQGKAEELPFPDGSFDGVVSQFGLMFFADRPGSIREMQRVLKPGGRLAVAVWSSMERSPGYAEEVALVEELAGSGPAEALRIPFGLGDRDALDGLLKAAGVSSLVVSEHGGVARFPSVRAMLEADLRGWLPLMGHALAEGLITHILEEAERRLARFVGSDGQVTFQMPALIASGTK